MEDAMTEILKKTGMQVKSYVIGQELHLDKTDHLHLVLLLEKRIDTLEVRFFDLHDDTKTYHPNVKTIQKNVQAVMEYCMKGGKYKMQNVNMFMNSNNFQKKVNDQNAWLSYQARKTRTLIHWPLTLNLTTPNGITPLTVVIHQALANQKKRNVWIVGEPDMGKTYAVQSALAGTLAFNRSSNEFPYETYEGEEVIVLDDIIPKLVEIFAVSQVYLMETSVYGKVRYVQKYWPLNQVRHMIVLTNAMPSYSDELAFKARFTVVDFRYEQDARHVVCNLGKPEIKSTFTSMFHMD